MALVSLSNIELALSSDATLLAIHAGILGTAGTPTSGLLTTCNLAASSVTANTLTCSGALSANTASVVGQLNAGNVVVATSGTFAAGAAASAINGTGQASTVNIAEQGSQVMSSTNVLVTNDYGGFSGTGVSLAGGTLTGKQIGTSSLYFLNDSVSFYNSATTPVSMTIKKGNVTDSVGNLSNHKYRIYIFSAQGSASSYVQYTSLTSVTYVVPGLYKLQIGLVWSDMGQATPNTTNGCTNTYTAFVPTLTIASGGLVVSGGAALDSLTCTGNVGIGTTTPAYPLEVVPVSNTGPQYCRWFNVGGSGGPGSSTGNLSLGWSIYAHGSILSTEFNALSDRRIKRDVEVLDGPASLTTVRGLSPCEFRYVDPAIRGDDRKAGFIAQEVADVLGSAVRRTTEFVPTILRQAVVSGTPVDGDAPDTFELVLSGQGDDLPSLVSVGDVLKIAIQKGQGHDVGSGDQTVVVVDVRAQSVLVRFEDTMTTKTPTGAAVFLVGKRVHDFHVLDYEQITSVSVAAIKQLLSLNDAFAAQVAAHAEQIAAFAARLERNGL